MGKSVEATIRALQAEDAAAEKPQKNFNKNKSSDKAQNKENQQNNGPKQPRPPSSAPDEQAMRDLLELYKPKNEKEKQVRGVLRQYDQNGFPPLQYYQAPQWRFFRAQKPNLNSKAKGGNLNDLGAIDHVQRSQQDQAQGHDKAKRG